MTSLLNVYETSDYEMHTKYYDKYLTPRKLRWFTTKNSTIYTFQLSDDLLAHILTFVLYPHQIDCPHRKNYNKCVETLPRIFRNDSNGVNIVVFFKEYHYLPGGLYIHNTYQRISGYSYQEAIYEQPDSKFNNPYAVFQYQLKTKLKTALSHRHAAWGGNWFRKSYTIAETTNVPAAYSYDTPTYNRLVSWYKEIGSGKIEDMSGLFDGAGDY
jgi:hypothetical protein